LVLKLESHSELQASGQVIRCVPVRTSSVPQYEVAFSFDEAVGPPPAVERRARSLALAPKALLEAAIPRAQAEQPEYLLLPA
jgi:hypothetical protein